MREVRIIGMVREVWNLSLLEAKRVISSVRFLIGLLITFCGIYLTQGDLGAYLGKKELSIGILELFPFTMSDPFMLMILLLIYTFMLCDVPFVHDGMDMEMIRTDWGRWLLSKVVTVIEITILWLIMIEASIVIMQAGNCEWNNEWSVFIKTAARTGGRGISQLNLSVSMDICQTGTPVQAFLISYALNLLFYVLLAVSMLTLNIMYKGRIGMVCAIVFEGIRYMNRAEWSSKFLRLLSPADLVNLCDGGIQAAKLFYSFGYLIALTGVLLCFCHSYLKKNGVSV